ncbi:MAG: tellurite resistance/C4-dicarboxylate transporter family protein [Actinomycetota bacterium]
MAGTNVLGEQLALVGGAPGAAVALWWVGLALWAVLLYAFLTAVTFAEPKPDLGAGIQGAWLLLVVSTESIAVLGDGRPHMATRGVLFVALFTHLIGAMLYMVVIGLIFYRWTFFPMAADTRRLRTGSTWERWRSRRSRSALLLAAPGWDLLEELAPFLKGSTLLFWAFATTWWVPLLIIMGRLASRVPPRAARYDPQLWAIVFPLGMYSVATARMIDAIGLPFGAWIGAGAFWVSFGAWVVTAVAMAFAEGRTRS